MALIVVFAALAGASGSIDGIVGFRSLLAAADAGPHGEPDVVGGSPTSSVAPRARSTASCGPAPDPPSVP